MLKKSVCFRMIIDVGLSPDPIQLSKITFRFRHIYFRNVISSDHIYFQYYGIRKLFRYIFTKLSPNYHSVYHVFDFFHNSLGRRTRFDCVYGTIVQIFHIHWISIMCSINMLLLLDVWERARTHATSKKIRREY